MDFGSTLILGRPHLEMLYFVLRDLFPQDVSIRQL